MIGLMDKAIIYTDGSCHGNPGSGGYAAVVLHNGITREVHGSDWHTTNNRMELTAVIQGLKLLPYQCEAHIISDSRYVVNPIRQNSLKSYTVAGNRKNADLWEQVLRLSAFHPLTAEWVKGHAGNRFNQRCDTLANKEAASAERESGIRLFVFRELLSDITATPEQICIRYGGKDFETIKKYHTQYFEHYNSAPLPQSR